jgi:GTP-binding protein
MAWPTAEDLARGERLFARPCDFVYAAQRLDQLPAAGLPEIGFVGRSNVGKSSLLNALTGRRALARASNTPGRTRQLNFFDLGGVLTLVDMPGYGYARAGREMKEDWQGMMFDYLRGRPTLVRVLLLLDARIELKPSDVQVMDLLGEAAVTYMVVLTKVDALTHAALEKKYGGIEQLTRTRAAAFPRMGATSSKTGQGIGTLRAELAVLAEPDGEGALQAGLC